MLSCLRPSRCCSSFALAVAVALPAALLAAGCAGNAAQATTTGGGDSLRLGKTLELRISQRSTNLAIYFAVASDGTVRYVAGRTLLGTDSPADNAMFVTKARGELGKRLADLLSASDAQSDSQELPTQPTFRAVVTKEGSFFGQRIIEGGPTPWLVNLRSVLDAIIAEARRGAEPEDSAPR